MDTKKKRRVVITGLGTVNPTGNTVAESWANIKAGRCAVGPITTFDTADFKVKLAAEVKDFDPAARIDKREARKMARFTQFAVVAAKEALEDCGSDLKDLDPYRCGVIIGCGVGGLEMTQKQHSIYLEKGPNRISPFFVPMMISNMAGGQVAMKTNFRGDNYCTVTACASATHAIGEAFRKIKDGYLDACRRGGMYCPKDSTFSRLREGLDVSVVSSRRMSSTISGIRGSAGYLLSPYAALAYAGLLDFRGRTGESCHALVLAEKNPVCDAGTVAGALGVSEDALEQYL